MTISTYGTPNASAWSDEWLTAGERRALRAIEAAAEAKYTSQYAAAEKTRLRAAQHELNARRRQIRARRIQRVAQWFAFGTGGILTALTIGEAVKFIAFVFGP